VIERSYPGVFVVEVPTHPTPIEGVPTAPTGADALRHATLEKEAVRLPAAAPEWADANPGDPGITLLQVLAYAFDAFVHRPGAAGPSGQTGVVAGLGVDAGTSGRVRVTPGVGVNAIGRPVDPNVTAVGRDVARVNGESLFSSGPFPIKWEGPHLAASASDVAIEPIELGNEGFVRDGGDASSRDGEPD
jgi:hypothetical protein